MAASGPKAIELAGEIADGVMLMVGLHRGIVDAVLSHLADGARRSGRRLDDLEIVWAVRTGMAATTAEAQRQARPIVVHQGILGPLPQWLAHTDLKLPSFDIPQAVRDIYPDLSHASDWEQAIAATAFVPDEVIAQLCGALGLVGTADDCARRIIEMTAVGVDNVYLMGFETFAGPGEMIRLCRDEMFPGLRAAGYR